MLEIPNPIPGEKIRLIVFDLDGTLIDSQQDLTNSIDAMLAEFAREPLPEEIIATYIGDGAGMLVRRALGDPQDERLVENALQHFAITASTSWRAPAIPLRRKLERSSWSFSFMARPR